MRTTTHKRSAHNSTVSSIRRENAAYYRRHHTHMTPHTHRPLLVLQERNACTHDGRNQNRRIECRPHRSHKASQSVFVCALWQHTHTHTHAHRMQACHHKHTNNASPMSHRVVLRPTINSQSTFFRCSIKTQTPSFTTIRRWYNTT
jgi:hypothetical protein